jgi:hypothetical protein
MSTDDNGANNLIMGTIEKKRQEIVCEFCNNSNYYNRAVNAQNILESQGINYISTIDNKIRSLNEKISDTEGIINHWTTFRQTTKDSHTARLNNLRKELDRATADRNSLITLYDYYKSYVLNLPDMYSSKWRAEQHTLSEEIFFVELKKCKLAVNAGIGVVIPDVNPPEYSSNEHIHTASLIGGRKSKKRKSRKSSRKSRKSSRKSRKSSRKSRK